MLPLYLLLFLPLIVVQAIVNQVQIFPGHWVPGKRVFISAWGSDDVVDQVVLQGNRSGQVQTFSFDAIQLVQQHPGVIVHSLVIPEAFQQDDTITFTIGNSEVASITGVYVSQKSPNGVSDLTPDLKWGDLVLLYTNNSNPMKGDVVTFSAMLNPKHPEAGNTYIDTLVISDSSFKPIANITPFETYITKQLQPIARWEVTQNFSQTQIYAYVMWNKFIYSDPKACPMIAGTVIYTVDNSVVVKGSSFRVFASSNDQLIASKLQFEYTPKGGSPVIDIQNLGNITLNEQTRELFTFS